MESSAPSATAKDREVSPDPAPATANARPKALGSAMVLFAAKSAAAEDPRPLLTAQLMLDILFQIRVKSASVSALDRVVAPLEALPIVPSSNMTHPVSAVVFSVTLTSPVVHSASTYCLEAIPRAVVG